RARASAPAALYLLHNARFQLHWTHSINFAVNIVITHAVDQANISNLRANFDDIRAAFDLQVFDHGDGVSIGKNVAHRVADYRRVGFLRGSFGGPLVRTLGADHQWLHLVRQVA